MIKGLALLSFLILLSGCTQQPLNPSNPASTASGAQAKVSIGVPPCCNGPYYDSVWLATSNDGVNWTEYGSMLLNHSSVPQPVQLSNGNVVVYYVNASIDTFDCSVTSDLVNFTYGNCKLYNSGLQKAWDPDVVKLPNGKYRLYYYGPKVVNGQADMSPNSVDNIYSAISTDGLNFYQESGIRFSYQGITDPAVELINGTWYMYASQIQNVVVAKSSDGLNFTFVGDYSTNGGVPGILQLKNGSALLYVCSNGISYMNPPNFNQNIQSGIAIPTPSNGGIVCDPGPIELANGKYVMYYKVHMSSGNQQLPPQGNMPPPGNNTLPPPGGNMPPLGNNTMPPPPNGTFEPLPPQ